MASNYWAKLWIEMLDDRKTATLPDSSWRRFVECILLAKELDEDGFLPPIIDMAFRLRTNENALGDDLTRLALAGLLELRDGNRWFVTNFGKRQSKMEPAERTARHRAATRKQRYSNESVTNRYTETETETEKEGEKERATSQARHENATSPLPPVSIRFEPADRTPGSNGVAYPSEPPIKQPDAAEDRAVAEMSAALTEVTGISARLNWRKGFGEFTEALVAAGYTARQVRDHYGRAKVAERWHWYESDWRGKKGDKPRLQEISETIAGAVADRPGQSVQENSGQSWLEKSIRLARANGLLPQSDQSNTGSPAVS